MGYKLITDGKNNYSVLDSNNELIGTTMESIITNQKLSLKNCETIKNGYDLFKLSMDFANDHEKETDMAYEFGRDMYSFGEGFKKAIEILGDKKFTEYQLNEVIAESWNSCEDNEGENFTQAFKRIKQSVEQTEWYVEIKMEPYYDGEFIEDGKTHVIEPKFKPVLDSDGCLILKRI
jgi:hypothetical protein